MLTEFDDAFLGAGEVEARAAYRDLDDHSRDIIDVSCDRGWLDRAHIRTPVGRAWRLMSRSLGAPYVVGEQRGDTIGIAVCWSVLGRRLKPRAQRRLRALAGEWVASGAPSPQVEPTTVTTVVALDEAFGFIRAISRAVRPQDHEPDAA